VPLYQEIMEHLRKEIQTKLPNSMILSERELEKKYDASRMTIRKAINLLEEEGLLYRVKNVGTFVSDYKLVKKDTSTIVSTSFDVTKEYKILYFDVKDNDKEIAEKLEISKQDQFIRIVRLNLKGNKPKSIDQIYIVRKQIDDKDMSDIRRIFEFSSKIETGSVNQTFEPIPIPVMYINLLGVELDTPIIKVTSRVVTKNGKIYAYIESYLHPDTKIEITM
jgi:Transcriptional regulators